MEDRCKYDEYPDVFGWNLNIWDHWDLTIESSLPAFYLKICDWGICTGKFVTLEPLDQSSKFFFVGLDWYQKNIYSEPWPKQIKNKEAKPLLPSHIEFDDFRE